MSMLLGVTSQGYYNYLKSINKPYKYKFLLDEMIKIIAEDECNDSYGSVRMWEALNLKKSEQSTEFPEVPSERTVYRIMKQNSLIHKVNMILSISLYTLHSENIRS
jgi:hypothetical protein